MKRIERLADEHAEACGCHMGCYCYDGFKAGFRKAREMAADVLFREICDDTPTAAIIFIRQLGEEEVEE